LLLTAEGSLDLFLQAMTIALQAANNAEIINIFFMMAEVLAVKNKKEIKKRIQPAGWFSQFQN
jgi:hypothetical protein